MGYLLLAHETHNLLAHHPACPNPTSTHGSMTRQPPPTSFLGVARSRSSRMEDHGSPPSHSSPVLHPASSLDAASAPLPHPADATSAPLPHPASLLDAASASLLGVDCVWAPWLSLFYTEAGTTSSAGLAPKAGWEACASRFSAPKWALLYIFLWLFCMELEGRVCVNLRIAFKQLLKLCQVSNVNTPCLF
jgi:hypothetical protein